MPDIIELNELLMGIQDVLDNGCSDSCVEKIEELMSATWIRAWLDD